MGTHKNYNLVQQYQSHVYKIAGTTYNGTTGTRPTGRHVVYTSHEHEQGNNNIIYIFIFNYFKHKPVKVLN